MQTLDSHPQLLKDNKILHTIVHSELKQDLSDMQHSGQKKYTDVACQINSSRNPKFYAF